MSKIPSLKDWLAVTNGGVLSVRSKQLKALDTALENYWKARDNELPTDLKPLRDALANWIGYKGPDWRNSQRNAPPKRIVEQLYDVLDTGSFSKEDLAAFKEQDEKRRERLVFLFAGTKFVSASKYEGQIMGRAETLSEVMAGIWRSAGRPAAKFAGPSVGAVAAGGAVVGIDVAVADMLKDMCDTSSLDEAGRILLEVTGVSAAEVIKTFAECLPLLGLATSAVQMFKSSGQAARAAMRAFEIGRRTGFILPGGDVAEAFKALHLLLRREAMNEARTAAIDASAFGARLALHAVDGGIGSSAAITVSSLVVKGIIMMRNAYRFNKATRAANQILSDRNNLDSRMFGVFPLLGCYMLLMCDTFEIVNMVRTEQARNGVVRFGTLGFKEQIEWIKRKHLDPVLATAAECISKSPLLLLDAQNQALFSKGTRLMHKEYKGKIPVYRTPEPN
jgi:hypothetical protein